MAAHHIEALDQAKAGHWDAAHELVQQHSDTLSCLIHGYLHRLEGDLDNARYWYDRAHEEIPGNTIAEEFQRLYALAGAD